MRVPIYIVTLNIFLEISIFAAILGSCETFGLSSLAHICEIASAAVQILTCWSFFQKYYGAYIQCRFHSENEREKMDKLAWTELNWTELREYIYLKGALDSCFSHFHFHFHQRVEHLIEKILRLFKNLLWCIFHCFFGIVDVLVGNFFAIFGHFSVTCLWNEMKWNVALMSHFFRTEIEWTPWA